MVRTLNPGEQKAAIILEVQDTPDGRLQANIANIWDDEADQGDLDPRLQVLYTKRRCISLARGYWATAVDINAAGDAQVLLSQRVKNYDVLYAQVQTEIERIEARAFASQPASGMIKTVVPAAAQAPYVGMPDPNDPRFRGSPYAALGCRRLR